MRQRFQGTLLGHPVHDSGPPTVRATRAALWAPIERAVRDGHLSRLEGLGILYEVDES